ncbi:MAG: zinc-ribbon domain-containing protein [Clostridia bacterium]|nr:zinc-ribbon domain-containing protein [Clostridia bacterium]
MKEKIKNLTVAPRTDYVIWSEDLTKIERETTLTVSAGCVALYLVNGVLKSVNIPGRSLIKSKAEDKDHSKLDLICVNTDKVFEICCGVGNIPFKDNEINVETVVGAHGECKIRIAQPWPLYVTFGHSPIDADEIDSYVKLKLNEIMTSRLAEVLQHYDYSNVMTQQSIIASDLEKRFSQCLNDIGLEVVSFALAGIMFNGEYQEKRKEYFEAQNRRQAEKMERRAKEREQRAEIDNVIAIANATKNLTPAAPAQAPAPAPAPQNNAGINQPVKYCPRCGMKMEQSAIFCPGCGKKL